MTTKRGQLPQSKLNRGFLFRKRRLSYIALHKLKTEKQPHICTRPKSYSNQYKYKGVYVTLFFKNEIKKLKLY